MKKMIMTLVLSLFLGLSAVPVLAAENTILILPDDFSASLGTFTIARNEPNINGFHQTVLKGIITGNAAETIPAQVNVQIPEDGEYYIWCRSRDFDSDQGRRKFRIGVNKTGFAKEFGCHGENGWKWELAGKVALEKGISTVKVYDISGYYARLDMIAITDSVSYQPPKTEEEADAQLEKYHMEDTGTVPEPVAEQVEPNQVFLPNQLYMTLKAENFENNLGTWSFASDDGIRNKQKMLVGRKDQNVSVTVPAYVTVPIPKDGIYYIWLRTKDSFVNQGSSTFQAMIDQTALGEPVGAHGFDGWYWEVRKIELKEGYHKLYLNDITANSPKLDIITITDDAAFVPSNKVMDTTILAYRYPFEPTKYSFGEPFPADTMAIPDGINSSASRPEGEVALTFNGKYVVFDTQPQIYNGKPYFPYQTMFGLFGIQTSWNAASQTATCYVTGTPLTIHLGDSFAYLEKKKIEMESAPLEENGTILIPVSIVQRFVDEDVEFTWNPDSKTLEIRWIEWK